MILRELRKNTASSVELILNGNQVSVSTWKGIHGNERILSYPSEVTARKDFNKRLAECRRQGFVETARSLSRQEFLSPEGRTQRYWAMEVDGYWRTTFSGRVGSWLLKGREKRFYDLEKMEVSCRRLIAARLRMGYRRVNHANNTA
jgi:predicted DNA-binding WGR domain protein